MGRGLQRPHVGDAGDDRNLGQHLHRLEQLRRVDDRELATVRRDGSEVRQTPRPAPPMRGAATLQGAVIALSSRAISDCARIRPCNEAEVCIVTAVWHRMMPSKCDVVWSVTRPATCQKMLEA